MFSRAGNFARRNALALVALFVALGGTSYAAFGVPVNSVGSAQIRNGAIPSGKLTVGNKNYLRLGFGAPAAAVALTVNASGPVALKTTLLLTPEEVDAAAKQSVDSRQPVTGRPGETAAPPRPVAASSPPT